MKKKCAKQVALALSAAMVFSAGGQVVSAQSNEQVDAKTEIGNLKVAGNVEPLAVEDENPVFSWEMISNVISQTQAAYQIVVSQGEDVIWDSGKVESQDSSVSYAGASLPAGTDYTWDLKVWDILDQEYSGSSKFSTGLKDTTLEAWDGAQFIGSSELVLDAASAEVWHINTDAKIIEGNKIGLIFGANDFRLNDNFQNVQNVEGENYIRLEIDLSNLKGDSGAVINAYRVGYAQGDSADTPYVTMEIKDGLITEENRNETHNIDLSCEASVISIQIDGQDIGDPVEVEMPFGIVEQVPTLEVSPLSTGNNFNTFPNLNSIGFASNEGEQVEYSNYQLLNAGSSDGEVLFDSKVGATYSIWNDREGVSVGEDGTLTVQGDTLQYADPSSNSMPMLRTEFAIEDGKEIENAKMYATAMGIYEVYINGERMGEDWFNPADSQYRDTLCYHAYDVTEMLQNGDNSVGAVLGGGWYSGYMTFSPSNYCFFGDNPAFLGKLVITYTDGSTQTIVTDPETWDAYSDGPVVYGDFFQGERYDANKEETVEGWSEVGYDTTEWADAVEVDTKEWIDFDLVARYDEPIREMERLTAQKVLNTHSDDNHTYTYDMGVAMSGVPSVTIPAGTLQEGDVVIFSYGEDIYPGNEDSQNTNEEYTSLYGEDGTYRPGVAGRVLHDTYRAALATDFYTASKEDETRDVVIQPSLTYRGYRYIQITIPGSEEPLELENIEGVVLSSVSELTGTYEAVTTDEQTTEYVNQLFSNIGRSQVGNFMSIPTDCPQRNERMGWTGDAQAFSRTATYNADVLNFFRQWMVALRNDQSETGGIGSTVPTYTKETDSEFADGTTWAAAVCMVPWQMYVQYGDTQIIEENFETMKAWLEGMDSFDFTVGDVTYTGLSGKTSGLADWLSVDGTTTSDIVNNAIYIYMMGVSAKMADAIGETEYAETLRQRHDQAKEEWNQVYVDPETGLTRNTDGEIIDSQSSYATPLNFNCFSDENMEFAAKRLAELAADPNQSGNGAGVVQSSSGPGGSSGEQLDCPAYSITTGFSGTPNILPALSKTGNIEDAYQMITCTEYASWLYPVTLGATTSWERWNSYELAFQDQGESSMNSFNHFALGSVGSWMYEYQLGITTDYEEGGAGYQNFVLQPQAGSNYLSLNGSYTSNYGEIESAWTAEDGTITSYQTKVPANTQATLYLPVEAANQDIHTQGVSYVGVEERNGVSCAVFTVSAGGYQFSIADGAITVELADGYVES